MRIIVVGDLHIGDLHPPCRTDNYLDTLIEKLEQIEAIREEEEAELVIQCGDVFDHWKQPPEVLNRVLNIRFNFDGIPGQHDLPGHSKELIHKTAFRTLCLTGVAEDISEYNITFVDKRLLIQGFGWNDTLTAPEAGYRVNIAVMHITTWLEPITPDQAYGHAKQLLKQMIGLGWDYVFTGDNHQTFITREGDHFLANPGSVMRMRADQVDHRPMVYVFDTDDLTLDKRYLEIKPVVSRTHIEKELEKEHRLNAFVERLGDTTEVGLSFIDNIMSKVNHKSVSPEVRKEVLTAVGR